MQDISNRSFYFFVGIISAMLFALGMIGYTGHSEFWSIFLSKYLAQHESFSNVLFSKSLFHLPLFLIHQIPLDDLSHLIAAKFLFSLVGLGTLLILVKIFLLAHSRTRALWIFSVLTLSPFILYELGHVRADLLSLLFFLLAVYFFRSRAQASAMSCIFLGLLCTPKAVAFLPLVLVGSSWPLLKRVHLFAISIFLIVFLLFILRTPWLKESYLLALDFFNESFVEAIRRPPWAQENIRFVLQFLYLQGFLIVFLLWQLQRNWPILSSQKRRSLLFLNFYFLLLLLIFPQRLPYFLVTIWILYLVSVLPNINFKLTKNLIALALVNFCFQYFLFIAQMRQNFGLSQFRLISRLSLLLSEHPNASIFDGTGVLPRKNTLPLFIGPFDSKGNGYTIKAVSKIKPHLIFRTIKVSLFEASAENFMRENYILIAPGISARSVSLTPGSIWKVDELLSAIAAIYDENSSKISYVSFRRPWNPKDFGQYPVLCLSDQSMASFWEVSALKACGKVMIPNYPGYELQIAVTPWREDAREWWSKENVFYDLAFKRPDIFTGMAPE